VSRPRTDKVVDLAEFAQTAERARAAGRTVALCHGCFDLLHVGHVHHFDQASRLADVLLVSVSADSVCAKGPGRPAFTLDERMAVIAALEAVDRVCAAPGPTAIEVIRAVRPHLYVKGPDYRHCPGARLRAEAAVVEELGGRLVHTDDRVTSSSTELFRRFHV